MTANRFTYHKPTMGETYPIPICRCGDCIECEIRAMRSRTLLRRRQERNRVATCAKRVALSGKRGP